MEPYIKQLNLLVTYFQVRADVPTLLFPRSVVRLHDLTQFPVSCDFD
jgi:hypothetical protein